jgi:hypothetical protein
VNDTAFKSFFTGVEYFTVKERAVLKIRSQTALPADVKQSMVLPRDDERTERVLVTIVRKE